MRAVLSCFFLCWLIQNAWSQDGTCAGRSLLPEIRRTHPQMWELAYREADAIPNGKGLLWKIERPGTEPSWLFGTIHVFNPFAKHILEAAVEALDHADVLALELAELSDPEISEKAKADVLAVMMLPSGITFDSGFTDEQKRALGAATALYGLPYFMARKIRPGVLAAILSTPPCAEIGAMRGEKGMDDALYGEAKQKGKEVLSLETLAEQINGIRAIDSVTSPEDLLDIIAIDQKKNEDIHATLNDLYAREEVSVWIPLMRRMPEMASQADSLNTIEKVLLSDRNVRMVERMLPLLAEGRAMVAVGALHLPGADGIVALLRDRGFTVTRVEAGPNLPSPLREQNGVPAATSAR